MRGRKWAALLAAVLAAAGLYGCGAQENTESSQSEVPKEAVSIQPEEPFEPDSEQYKALSDRGKEMARYFVSFPEPYQSMLEIDMDGIYMRTNGGVYGQENMDAFLADIQNGKAAELIKISYTVEGDPIFCYISYDGTAYYYFRDASRDKFGARDDQYQEMDYQYLRAVQREGPEQWVTEYLLTNEAGEAPADGYVIYWTETDKAPEDVVPIYMVDYEAVEKALQDTGVYYEDDSEHSDVLLITDGKADNPEVWDAFYEQVQANKTCQLNIREEFSGGRSLNRWLHYAGDSYWQKGCWPVDYFVYFGNDPEFEPKSSHDVCDYRNMEVLYVFESDGHIKVGLGHDWSYLDEAEWLTEEDFGGNLMPAIVEFDR